MLVDIHVEGDVVDQGSDVNGVGVVSVEIMDTGNSSESESVDDDDDATDFDLDIDESIPYHLNDDALNDEECPTTPIDSENEWENDCMSQRQGTVSEGKVKFSLYQLFKDAVKFKDAVADYSAENHRAVKFFTSNTDRIHARCVDKSCPFRIWCSLEPKFHKFQVKSLEDKHTCYVTTRPPLCDSRWLARKFIGKFRRNNNYKAADLKADCLETFGITVSASQCFRARQKALRKIQGNQHEHFARLRSYENELVRTNKGSTVLISISNEVPRQPIFQRMYVCFDALRKGWLEGCRPIIGLDGAFLKWFVKGEILSAVGRDGNDQMFPIAWAVVEVENTNSWSWFLRLLVSDLALSTGDGLTLVSDGQKGLLKAISDLLPNAKHRVCARHIYANWRKKFKQPELKPKFWAVAKSYTIPEMQRALEDIRKISAEAARDLEGKIESWCLAYFNEGGCTDVVHNNMSESFNSSIRKARTKPIISMLEEIRIATMERMTRRIDKISKWVGRITPKAQKELELRMEQSLAAHNIPNSKQKWEVHRGNDISVVDMVRKTCSCRVWDVSGIPCLHAISVVMKNKKDIVDYISPYYLKEFWERSYNEVLTPINGENMWPKSHQPAILPPLTRIMPGRPKRNRRKDPTESPSKKGKTTANGRIINCGHCLQPGHNKSGCAKRKAGEPPAPPLIRTKLNTGRPSTSSQGSPSARPGAPRRPRKKQTPSEWNLPRSAE